MLMLMLIFTLIFMYGASTTLLTDSLSDPHSGSLSLLVILSLWLWLWSNILCSLIPFYFLKYGNIYIQCVNSSIHLSIY
jgi:hypothetical protein